MASEQVIISEAIAKWVVEANGVAIQGMAVAATERPQSATAPRIGGPAMKQPSFNLEVDDKYIELKSFRIEVNTFFSTYNIQQTEQLAIVKN